jgi:hypothetical protein
LKIAGTIQLNVQWSKTTGFDYVGDRGFAKQNGVMESGDGDDEVD